MKLLTILTVSASIENKLDMQMSDLFFLKTDHFDDSDQSIARIVDALKIPPDVRKKILLTTNAYEIDVNLLIEAKFTEKTLNGFKVSKMILESLNDSRNKLVKMIEDKDRSTRLLIQYITLQN